MNSENQSIILPSNEINTTNSTQRNNEEKIKLEVLSPLDKKDDFRVKKYLKHIKDAVDNGDVKNLALSGVYGSGKSTIIKSFKSSFPNIKILHISLASFKEIKDSDYKEFKDQIQLNILQQIIYSQKADKLPESRIKRISEINILDKKYWITIFSFLGILISTYILLNFYKFQLNPNNWYFSNRFNDIFSDFSLSFLVLVTILFISLFFVGQVMIKLLINSKINKINLSGEAELGKKDDNKDILNKHIDEIIYFFEKIHIDIVVIEDLDRFNSTEIYSTLREVNFIINTYLENLDPSNVRKITFLYAIKDDLFLNELDRTKFFDLIIPAIPFVNYNNSKNVLSKKLDEIFLDENTFEKPSKEFINTASAFITDNRTLLNIINEFIIYKEQQRLEQEQLNPEKLLAIIIYKNLRPKDFSRLHTNSSNIDIVIKNKQSLIKTSIEHTENEIEDLKKEILDIKEKSLIGIKELNTVFLYYIKEKINNSGVKGLFIGEEKQSYESIIQNAIELSKLYDENIRGYYDGYPYEYALEITLEKIDQKVGYTYADRYNTILNKNENIFEQENKIKKLRDNFTYLESWSLEEILKTKNLSRQELREEFNTFYENDLIEEKERAYNDALLIFMLSNGYIDEHYREYISVFQQGGLNESDHQFKINLISKIYDPKPIGYELIDTDEIIRELPLIYYTDSRILNIGLVDTLVISRNSYYEKFILLLKTISQWNNNRIKEFLSSYIYQGSQKEKFIIELAQNWNEFWSIINNDSNFIEEDKKQILYYMLAHAPYTLLKSLNKEFQLSSYISNNVNVLFDFATEEEINRLEDILSSDVLNIKIKEIIPFPEKLNVLLDFIYERNLYEINNNNIGTIIEQKLDTHFDVENFNKSNLSYIYECQLDELTDYLELDNFKSYIDNAYYKLENEQYDDEENILKVLNNLYLSIDKKEKFLEKQENIISNIEELKKGEFYDLVIEKNKVKATWKNVYEHYHLNIDRFKDNLTTFINKFENCSDLIGESKIKLDVEKSVQDVFIKDLLSNNKIELNQYEDIVNNCISDDFTLSQDFDFKVINKEKVEILIDNNIIVLSENNYEKIKTIYADLHIELLLKDSTRFLQYIDEFGLSIEDKILVLQYHSLNDELRFNIIKNHISNLELEDEELAFEFVDKLLNNSSNMNINNNLLDLDKLKILLSHDFSDKIKINLINLLSGTLTNKNIVDIQSMLSEEYRVSPRSELMLENNSYNIQYIKLLQSIHIAGTAKPAKNNRIRVWLNDFTNEL